MLVLWAGCVAPVVIEEPGDDWYGQCSPTPTAPDDDAALLAAFRSKLAPLIVTEDAVLRCTCLPGRALAGDTESRALAGDTDGRPWGLGATWLT